MFGFFYPSFIFFFFESGPLFDLRLWEQARLAGQQVLGIHCVYLDKTRSNIIHYHTQLFYLGSRELICVLMVT